MSTTGQQPVSLSPTGPDRRRRGIRRTRGARSAGARWSALAGLTLGVVSACGATPASPGPSAGQATTSGGTVATSTSDGTPAASAGDGTVTTTSSPGATVNPAPIPSPEPTGDLPTSAAGASSAGSPTPPAVDPGVPTSVSSDLPGLPGGAAVTLTGTVTEGVERGCVVLVDDSGTALASLLGFDRQAHPFGSRITVTGRWATDRVSFCQQGPLLAVRSIATAG